MARDDSGPAFPISADVGNQWGMSLRDYFAAKAMQALAAERFNVPLGGKASEVIAATAYLLADAMLKERDAE